MSVSILMNRYQFLSNIRKQIDACLQSLENENEKVLMSQLSELKNLMDTGVNLFRESSNLRFFSREPSLPHDFKAMMDEANALIQTVRITNSLNNRTS